MPTKRAAEAQSQSGHDIVLLSHADPFLFENLLVDVAPLVETLGKRYGGWYPFAAESAQTGAGWRAVPWYWVAFPATYNMAHFRKAGLEYPRSWDELLKHGRVLKKQGNPVGIPISHCGDANTTFWSVFWCYGGKVLEVDGKTPAINSEKTAQVLEWYKELFKDAMEPEVLSWDDSGNNRFILSGKGSWIHNPISPYNSALSNKMPIADDINHHPSPAGPAGVHSAPGINAIGIWKFSKNVEPAKEFIEFLFRKENFDAFIVASNAFNQPPLRDLADHPIWVKNPKFAMLPKEAEFAHARGWPAKPNDAVRRIENNYVLPDMVAKAIQGMPVKRVMEWGQEQVVQAVKGQLKASG
jgi:multiple sugar transport system substrate-binding protein